MIMWFALPVVNNRSEVSTAIIPLFLGRLCTFFSCPFQYFCGHLPAATLPFPAMLQSFRPFLSRSTYPCVYVIILPILRVILFQSSFRDFDL